MREYFESTIKSHPSGESKIEVGSFVIVTFRDSNVFNVFIQDTSNHHQKVLHFIIDGHVHALVGEKGYYQSSFLLHEVIEKDYQIFVETKPSSWLTTYKRLPKWNQVHEVEYENDTNNGVDLEPELELLNYFKSVKDFGLFFQLKEGVEEANFSIEILDYPEGFGCGIIHKYDVKLNSNSIDGKYYYLQTNCEDNIYRVLKHF